MLLNDASIQIGTAIPPVEPVDTRKGRTFLADVWTDKGRTQAYLKLLNIEDIAREALCATLARYLGLPIAQAFYVSVDPSYVDGQVIGNDQNITFGLRNNHTSAIRNIDLDNLVHDWKEPDIINCAVFDEWIFNRDRLPHNLRFDTTKVYWLIDHDETLPNYASPEAPANSSLLRLLSKSRSEFELWKLREKAMVQVQRFERIEWDKVLELLRSDILVGSEIHFARYIEFLQNRLSAMHSIITTSIGIQQRQLDLGNRPVSNNKSKEEK
ncbi:MAG: hypothetical protein OXC42_08250 [Gammaproteobacteria bacterium]|nr:hypothetical protein [Gammaproteobacteria bacterium]